MQELFTSFGVKPNYSKLFVSYKLLRIANFQHPYIHNEQLLSYMILMDDEIQELYKSITKTSSFGDEDYEVKMHKKFKKEKELDNLIEDRLRGCDSGCPKSVVRQMLVINNPFFSFLKFNNILTFK